MRKLQVVMLVLLGVLAVSAVVAGSAFAELAEWLENGSTIAAGKATTTTGELLLEDNEAPVIGKAAVLCSGIIVGTVNANGANTVTEILNLKVEKITELSGGKPLLGEGAGTDCVTETGCSEGSNVAPIEVYPIGLPWTSTLTKSGGVWTDSTKSATELGYELLCLVLDINTVDKCTYSATQSVSVTITNGGGGGNAEIPSGATASPLATCTASGGKASGVITFDSAAEILLAVGVLSVS